MWTCSYPYPTSPLCACIDTRAFCRDLPPRAPPRLRTALCSSPPPRLRTARCSRGSLTLRHASRAALSYTPSAGSARGDSPRTSTEMPEDNRVAMDLKDQRTGEHIRDWFISVSTVHRTRVHKERHEPMCTKEMIGSGVIVQFLSTRQGSCQGRRPEVATRPERGWNETRALGPTDASSPAAHVRQRMSNPNDGPLDAAIYQSLRGAS